MYHDSYWNLDTPNYDSTSPNMVSALQGFISAYGAKYDGDPRIGFITMGLIGYWGEWHTWPYNGTGGYANYFPSDATVNAVIDAYTAAFKQTQLEIRYQYLGSGHAAASPVGFHDDSWGFMEGGLSDTLSQSMGGNSYSFLQNALNNSAENAWINYSIGGEARPEIQSVMFNYWPGGNSGANVSNMQAVIEQTHATWMINQNGINGYSPSDPNVAAAVHEMGYELYTDKSYFNSSVNIGSQFKVGVQIENKGTARFYYPWQVQVGLKNSSGAVVKTWTTNWDIIQVQPLQIRAFPDWNVGSDPTYLAYGYPFYYDTTLNSTGISSGTYTVVMSVVNPLSASQSSAKKLRFANDTQNTDGWLGLGSITFQTGPTATPTFIPPTAIKTNTPQPTATSSGTIGYEAESSANTLAGGAIMQGCTGCSGGQAVGYIGNASGTLTFNNVVGPSSQITVYFVNGGTTAPNAQIRVNGGSPTTVTFGTTANWNTNASQVVSLTLNSGSNIIEFSNDTSGQWTPDIDKINNH